MFKLRMVVALDAKCNEKNFTSFESDFTEELESVLEAFKSDLMEACDSGFETLVFNNGFPLVGSLTLN